jgi:putative solute:sodium symporter small subunit
VEPGKIQREDGMTDHYSHSPPRTATGRSAQDYWSANLRIIAICLVIWAVASFGFAILLRPLLSGIGVGGTDLGFWFAQQGSILVFVVLIFFYAWRMNRLDREFGVDEEG